MPSINPNPESNHCAFCQKPSSTRCTGCLNAPVYDKVIKPTFYCNAGCQRADWERHKVDCRVLQNRKKLHRAALLLQAIFHSIRTHASPMKFDRMLVKGSEVHLWGYRHIVEDKARHLYPFQLSVKHCENRRAALAALVYNGCVESLVYLYEFVKNFLDGDPNFNVTVINAAVANPELQLITLQKNGTEIRFPGNEFHNLYKITLGNGDVWALDPTCAQFGHSSPLQPWHDFLWYRATKINNEYDFGYMRSPEFNKNTSYTDRFMLAHETEKLELAGLIDGKIPELASKYNGKLENILKGSDATFAKAKDVFLAQLDVYLSIFMIEMYTPEQIARRANVVEAQFSLIMKDPDAQKRDMDMASFVASTGPSLTCQYL